MFRFTIRDVLWLTAVVACLVVWWIDRQQLLSGLAGTAERKTVG